MSWPTPGAARLIYAMVVAEGGPAAFLRAVRISVPSCATDAEARAIAANTIAHALWDFGVPTDHALWTFVSFLGARWAPIGADNDPTNLNANWVPNVLAHLAKHRQATA